MVLNLSIWMQNIGAAWLMTELQPGSPLMVSLVQTAMALPAFLLGLPSGVLADMVNRRRFLFLTLGGSIVFASVLAGLSLSGALGPWLLLALTFALGCTNAFGMSAWVATNIDCAPAGQIPAAIALATVTPNIARVLGPALAGALIAFTGFSSLFVTVSLGLLLSALLLRALPNMTVPPRLPPERMWSGMLSGLRYMRHSAQLRLALRLVFVFVTAGSGIWALLPLVAREQLGLGPGGFGLLMGSLGIGAVLSALQITRLYRHFSVRQIIAGGGLLFALVTALIPLIKDTWVMCSLLMLGGIAWMAVNTTAGTVIQTSAAVWVRARVASIYLLVIMGAMAAGGALWGVIAERLGIANSLWIASAAIFVGLLLTGRAQMQLGSEADLSTYIAQSENVDDILLEHDKGPVAVEIAYRIASRDEAEFIGIAHEVGLARKRNGALAWRLYRDLESPERLVERFLVNSWLDYLRQAERITRNDQQMERRLQMLAIDGNVTVRRYLAEA